ncbi:imm11 family protein [Hyalangium gracile]|uniref:imm11 family protein n=1 Tax=Hyalangium gracile TaxID=394092 RepID=UPI001CCBECFD|nr:DUF1629 domain-containing protein [Hyalangium gracile]
MPRYFRLRDDMSIPGRWVLGAPLDERGKDIDPWQFEKGRVVEPGSPPRFPLLVRGQPLDFSGAAFGILVVHERLVRLFEQQGWQQEVQFIPARVDEQPEPYFVLNTLRTIRCIDEARSGEIDFWRPEHGEPERVGAYRAVHGLKVDPTKIEGAHIFRTWGWSVALIVSEHLKDILEREHITGVKFVEV